MAKTKTKKRFEYVKRDACELKARADKRSNRFETPMKDPVPMMKLEDGKNYHVRICPPTWEDATHYGYDVGYYRNLGPEGKDRSVSRTFMGLEGDPILGYINELKSNGETKRVKDVNCSDRVFYYVIDRDNESAGVQCLDVPQGVDADLAKICKDRRTGRAIDIDLPDEGYDIFFDRAKNDAGFPVCTRLQLDPQGASNLMDTDERQDEILDWLVEHPLPDYVNIPGTSELEVMVAGMKATNPTTRATDEDTTPAPRTRSRARRREPTPEEEHEKEREQPEPEEPQEPINDADADLDEPAPKAGGLRPRVRR